MSTTPQKREACESCKFYRYQEPCGVTLMCGEYYSLSPAEHLCRRYPTESPCPPAKWCGEYAHRL